MNTKINKVVGLKKADFDSYIGEDFFIRPARLIPTYPIKSEMNLTSVFLSALRLIKEFRNHFFHDAKIMKGGQVFVYTEIEFPEFKESRIDGLIIIVKSGEIRDAALLEMKNGNANLDQVQIEKYIEIAKKFHIPKVITVSNEFVSEPTQSPMTNIKRKKNVNLFHFSWSNILTFALVLLFKNDINIDDEDQIEIMKEVVAYFENDKAGVCGFNQMKSGWKELVTRIKSGAHILMNDSGVIDTVTSWHQEEKDMALILSRKLGVFVKSGERKFKGDLNARINSDKKRIINEKELISHLKIHDAVSDITIKVMLEKRLVEMSVKINVPMERSTIKGQIGWLEKQLKNCQKKNPESFNSLQDELVIELTIKRSGVRERISYSKMDDIHSRIKNKEIKEFGIVQIKDFKSNFSGTKKFVEILEVMLTEFYGGLVQHLSNPKQKAPALNEKE